MVLAAGPRASGLGAVGWREGELVEAEEQRFDVVGLKQCVVGRCCPEPKELLQQLDVKAGEGRTLRERER